MNKLFERIKEIALNNPYGFTIRVPDCSAVRSGWVVAMKETQNCFGDEGLEKVLEMALKTTFLVGGWKDGKLFYYDAVYIIDNEEKAVQMAILNNQKVIFSLGQVRELYIS